MKLPRLFFVVCASGEFCRWPFQPGCDLEDEDPNNGDMSREDAAELAVKCDTMGCGPHRVVMYGPLRSSGGVST